MRVAIIGVGAMGGVFGAAFAAVGEDVVLVDVSAPLVDRINEAGLEVEADGARAVHRLVATTDVESEPVADLVFVFVKGYHTRAALDLAKPMIGPATIVATLQNGWGNGEAIGSAVDLERVVIGVTNNSATVRDLASVAHTGRGITIVGPAREGSDLGPAESVRNLLQAAGFECESRSKVAEDIWRKLVLNAATLPTSALTGMTAGRLGQPGEVLDLVDAVAREAVAVANAQGYELDEQERVDYIHQLLAGAGDGKASMLQDLEAGRRTEIDTINGAIVRLADEAGVPAPLNRACTALIRGYEQQKGLA
ncbi:MAG: 2-dehydropantoate 2-reductase [Dehalococcoidia bacterium]